MILVIILLKIDPISIWMGHIFSENWYIFVHFQILSGISLLKPKLGTLGWSPYISHEVAEQIVFIIFNPIYHLKWAQSLHLYSQLTNCPHHLKPVDTMSIWIWSQSHVVIRNHRATHEALIMRILLTRHTIQALRSSLTAFFSFLMRFECFSDKICGM